VDGLVKCGPLSPENNAKKKPNRLVSFILRLIRQKPIGAFGAVIVILFFFTGVFADVLAPFGMNEIDHSVSLETPSTAFPLGTDNLGRDVLSRVIYGARISMIVGVGATVLSIGISLILGILTGFFGGVLDLVVQRFVDAWMCFPGIVILITASSILGPGLWQVILILGILYGIGDSRIIRSAVISIKENMYIDAAITIGCSPWRIIWRHVLPHIMAPTIVLFSVSIPAVIMDEAALSFLGLGIPPPFPSWGGMLSGVGRRFLLRAPWLALFPGLSLSIVVYGVNMFGDAVRDLLDPRLRGGGGRYGKAGKKLSLKKRRKSASDKTS